MFLGALCILLLVVFLIFCKKIIFRTIFALKLGFPPNFCVPKPNSTKVSYMVGNWKALAISFQTVPSASFQDESVSACPEFCYGRGKSLCTIAQSVSYNIIDLQRQDKEVNIGLMVYFPQNNKKIKKNIKCNVTPFWIAQNVSYKTGY